MTPQQQPAPDAEALQELGRASVEIVHDIKNQLNGLKLYATFLRRRCERDERPADELETVNKIIAGLDRAAEDLATLVRFGRPLELKRTPPTDLAEIVRAACEGAQLETVGDDFRGDFDRDQLRDALRALGASARAAGGDPNAVTLRREESPEGAHAVVEWHGLKTTGAKEIFRALDGNDSLRAALAAKIVRAHGGDIEQRDEVISVRIPLRRDEG